MFSHQINVFIIQVGGGNYSSRAGNMVTMNSEKAAIRRKPEPNNGGCIKPSNEDTLSTQQTPEESPNNLLYKKVSLCFRLAYYLFLKMPV